MSRAQNEVFKIMFLCIYLGLIGSMKKKHIKSLIFFILSYKREKILISQILHGQNNTLF